MGYKQSNPIRNFKFSIKNIKFIKEEEMKKPIHNLFGLKNGRLLANSNNEILLLNQENFEILFTLRLPHQPQEILEIKHDKILFALFNEILIYEIFLNDLYFIECFSSYPKLYGDLISIIELKYCHYNLISYTEDSFILFWKKYKENNYSIQTIISIEENNSNIESQNMIELKNKKEIVFQNNTSLYFFNLITFKKKEIKNITGGRHCIVQANKNILLLAGNLYIYLINLNKYELIKGIRDIGVNGNIYKLFDKTFIIKKYYGEYKRIKLNQDNIILIEKDIEIFSDIEPSSYVFMENDKLLFSSYGNIVIFDYSNKKSRK